MGTYVYTHRTTSGDADEAVVGDVHHGVTVGVGVHHIHVRGVTCVTGLDRSSEKGEELKHVIAFHCQGTPMGVGPRIVRLSHPKYPLGTHKIFRILAIYSLYMFICLSLG